MIALISQMAEAKTILYVTNTATDTPCNALQQPDTLYCSRLVNLGYDVKVLNEMHVKDNSTTWNEYADSSSMIFLGNDNQDMDDKTKWRDVFCGNISAKNKPVFTTFVNNWKSGKIEGCAFFFNLTTFNYSDNKCSTKAFKIAKTGFVTEGFDLDENITIYPSPKVAKISDISNGGWVTAECTPPNASIEFYPVIHADDKGVFWGLDEPQSFSNATWDIFDRTVLQLLGDTAWSITAFALPRIATINQDVWIFANVTQNDKSVSGIVNFTTENISGNMNYDGFWKFFGLKLPEERQYAISLNAYSKSLRGAFNLPINAGRLSVNILSANFRPNSNYFLSASIPGANSASYRILNLTNYNVINAGDLICNNGLCTGTVENMPDTNSLLVEVTASGSSVGGTLKTITKEALATDKNIYKPGEIVSIDLFTNESLPQPTLTITKPDNTKESPLQMDNMSINHWRKGYTLGVNSLNGTYSILAVTTKGNYNKSFDVIAWSPFAYLNKGKFDLFENLLLTVGTTNAYSNNLGVAISADITEPDSSIIPLGNVTVNGNSNYNFSFVIPKNYPSGASIVKIFFKDSANRSSTLYLNFSTNITTLQPSLFATPSTISVTTASGKRIEKTITLENSAQVNATSIISNVSDLNMVVVVPPFINPKSKSEAKITIITEYLYEGTYTGKIDFYSQVGDAEVTVNLEIVGDISSEASKKYADIVSLESNLTYLEKMFVNTTDALLLLNETKAMLNDTIKEYKNENYATAKAKFDEASVKVDELETSVKDLYGKLPDYSFIIWDFAAAIIVIIITLAIIKIKGRRKKQKKEKKEIPKEEPPKEEVYFEPKGGDYRTEYY